MTDLWTPDEERFIGRIVDAALKKSRKPPGFWTYGHIAYCINEAGRRLQAIGYRKRSDTPPPPSVCEAEKPNG